MIDWPLSARNGTCLWIYFLGTYYRFSLSPFTIFCDVLEFNVRANKMNLLPNIFLLYKNKNLAEKTVQSTHASLLAFTQKQQVSAIARRWRREGW